MATERNDLDEILDAIRDVEASLDRRAARASAATGMVWGLAVTLVFAYYHWYAVDPAAAAVVPRDAVPWLWIVPVALAYAATTAIGARLGRVRGGREAARPMRRLLAVLVVPLAILVFVLATGNGQSLIPGMWVAFLGVVYLGITNPEDPSWARVTRVLGVASLVAGVALAVVPVLQPWGLALAGAWYAVFLFGASVVEYQIHGR